MITAPRFQYAIGNPPYQEALGGSGHVLSIYPDFLYAAGLIAQYTTMVHPVRAFRGAGRVNRSVVNNVLMDDHFTFASPVMDSDDLFPSADIRGGVILTTIDHTGHTPQPPIRGRFAQSSPQEATVAKLLPPPLVAILDHVLTAMDERGEQSIMEIIHSYMDSQWSDTARAEWETSFAAAPHQYYLQTNVFTTLPELFHDRVDREFTADGAMEGHYRVLGRNGGRVARYVRKEYLDVPNVLQHGYRLFVPKANGNGDFGERLAETIIGTDDMLYTATFILFGTFDTIAEAAALQQYVNTRFVRALLGVLKVTQDNTRKTWRYVPLQDFTATSDLDWQSVDTLDEQLAAKYGLTDEQQQWLVEHVQEAR